MAKKADVPLFTKSLDGTRRCLGPVSFHLQLFEYQPKARDLRVLRWNRRVPAGGLRKRRPRRSQTTGNTQPNQHLRSHELLDRNDIAITAVELRLWLSKGAKALDEVVNQLTV